MQLPGIVPGFPVGEPVGFVRFADTSSSAYSGIFSRTGSKTGRHFGGL